MSRIPAGELAERLRQTDLVVSDVDECFYPFITQAEAALAIFRRALRDSSRRVRAARMSWYALHIAAAKNRNLILNRPDNETLIRLYEKLVRGVSLEEFRGEARRLAPLHVPGAPDTLARFRNCGVPVGFVSLGLDVLLSEQVEWLRENRGCDISFFDCTRMCFDADGRFTGYDPLATYTRPEHKPPHFRRRAGEAAARHPLVIGHDEDDVAMLEDARRMGGIAIGVRPSPRCREHVDVMTAERDWRPLDRFLETVFRGC